MTGLDALEPPQFMRVLLLPMKELFGEINDRIVIGGSVEIDVGDDRILAAQKGLALEGIGNLRENSMVTNLVLDEQVDKIAQCL